MGPEVFVCDAQSVFVLMRVGRWGSFEEHSISVHHSTGSTGNSVTVWLKFKIWRRKIEKRGPFFVLYYTILYYTILYYTILYYTIPYHTILYYTVLDYTILYYTILYDTTPDGSVQYEYTANHCIRDVWLKHRSISVRGAQNTEYFTTPAW